MQLGRRSFAGGRGLNGTVEFPKYLLTYEFRFAIVLA